MATGMHVPPQMSPPPQMAPPPPPPPMPASTPPPQPTLPVSTGSKMSADSLPWMPGESQAAYPAFRGAPGLCQDGYPYSPHDAPPGLTDQSPQELGRSPHTIPHQEAGPFCMMSTPKQLKAMQEKLSYTIFEMEKQKTALWKDIAALQNQKDEAELEIRVLDVDSGLKREALAQLEEDDRQTNKAWEQELDKRQEDLDAKFKTMAETKREMDLNSAEFERQSDVVELRKDVAAEKEDFQKKMKFARVEFDRMVSELEKKHQKTLQDMRSKVVDDRKQEIDKRVREALKAQAKEHDKHMEDLKGQIVESSSKKDKDDSKKLKALEQRFEQLNANLEQEKTDRKQLFDANTALREENQRLESDLKGVRLKLKEHTERHQEAEAELMEQYEERLAISQSIVETQSPTDRARSRREEVMRKQQEALEAHSRRAEPVRASSSCVFSSPQQPRGSNFLQAEDDVATAPEQDDDDVQRAIKESESAANREQQAMEAWIKSQCLDMGIENIADLDGEMRAEMERAYRARS